MRTSAREQLKKAEAEVAQARAKRQRIAARVKQQERAEQRRRAFVAGDLTLEMLRDDPRFRDRFLDRLDQRLKSSKDRELFGLSPKPGDETDAPEPERNPELDGRKPSGNGD